jgi:hypothetical protein
MRNYFMLAAESKGYEVIDMHPIFIRKNRADGSRFEHPTDGHWNALGHKLVADAIEGSAVFSRTFRGAARAETASGKVHDSDE